MIMEFQRHHLFVDDLNGRLGVLLIFGSVPVVFFHSILVSFSIPVNLYSKYNPLEENLLTKIIYSCLYDFY